MPIPTPKNKNEKYKVTNSSDVTATKDFMSMFDNASSSIGHPGIPDSFKKAFEDMMAKPKESGHSKTFIHTDMAAEFGEGESSCEWVKKLDKELKVACFFVVKGLKEAKKDKKTLDWDFVVSLMNNCDGITQIPDSHKKKYDTFNASEGTDYFRFQSAADKKAKVNRIMSWFTKAVHDTDPTVSDFSLSIINMTHSAIVFYLRTLPQYSWF